MSELFRCGWCGSPCQKDGTPMSMSEVGLVKDIALWDTASPVEGACCGERLRLEEEYLLERQIYEESEHISWRDQ